MADIVDRIRKLLALANDKGATEAEAALAAAKAAEIMEQHGIEMATVVVSGGEGEQRRKDDASVSGLAREKWAITLMDAVAQSCFVNAFATYRYPRGKPVLTGFEVYGRHSAVITCQHLYEYLSRTVIRLSRKETDSQRFFRFGCAERLAQRLEERHRAVIAEQRRQAREQQAAAHHPAATGNALVVVLGDYEQDERDLNNDMRRGVPAGTTRREREESLRRTAAKNAAIKKLQAEGHSWDIAWWMTTYNCTKEEAEQRETRWQKEQGHRRKDRVDFDERRREHASYRRGEAAGNDVSLDKQIRGTK